MGPAANPEIQQLEATTLKLTRPSGSGNLGLPSNGHASQNLLPKGLIVRQKIDRSFDLGKKIQTTHNFCGFISTPQPVFYEARSTFAALRPLGPCWHSNSTASPSFSVL
jgi:hypothetical protein